jgi:hypothetical protein
MEEQGRGCFPIAARHKHSVTTVDKHVHHFAKWVQTHKLIEKTTGLNDEYIQSRDFTKGRIQTEFYRVSNTSRKVKHSLMLHTPDELTES